MKPMKDKLPAKIKLSEASENLLLHIAIIGGSVKKQGCRREGSALERRGLVRSSNQHYKITAAGRKYLHSVSYGN